MIAGYEKIHERISLFFITINKYFIGHQKLKNKSENYLFDV